ncbi:DUF3891 family protein [Paenibacillus sp. FSL R7-0337]|uniref:DUF3891 family protein n=1 Tax=Paenibacillus sp. FSL R7-0337 TaxID=1926588 RepID=UPI00096E7B9A|nr:DUF3891 family protein [Paenibacillus sp. FSL R7-0337]OMF85136.1 hypothetical protein BK147_32430 [Paenibacillus sp. FSL R7-0337]
MICREQDGTLVMTKQHEHGLLAGEFAKWFKEEHTPAEGRRAEVLWAVSNHDRGWIDLDETPFWNDAEGQPYSFLDFPVVPKLTFYRRGIDEIEAETPYGALLCSSHFERLIEVSGEECPELTQYLQDEADRRARIHRALEQSKPLEEGELYYDARLLQFCDDLSLFLALSKPGSTESEKHPWFVDGFSSSEEFSFTSGRTIEAEWQDSATLTLTPFPFTQEVEVSFKQRRVSRADIKDKGIARAYREAPEEECRIKVVSGPEEDSRAKTGAGQRTKG